MSVNDRWIGVLIDDLKNKNIVLEDFSFDMLKFKTNTKIINHEMIALYRRWKIAMGLLLVR